MFRSLIGGFVFVVALQAQYDESSAIERACSFQRLTGAGAYDRCIDNQKSALGEIGSKPSLTALPPAKRGPARESCAVDEAIGGPAAYYGCLEDQIAKANGGAARELRKPVMPPNFERGLDQILRMPPKWSGVLLTVPLKDFGTPMDAVTFFRRVSPSVYKVLTFKSEEDAKKGAWFMQGSAVALSNGILATNQHVVEGARFVVVVQSKQVYVATIRAMDKAADRCLLSITGMLQPVSGVRGFHKLQVGEKVFAIGSPRGFDQTLSEGIVSGLREEKGIHYIQTTAPISPGSSGGGLFDAAGNLMGITTMHIEKAEALNFAIAAEDFVH